MITCITFMSCNNKSQSYYTTIFNLDTITNEKQITDSVTDIQFVPLENKRSCMLSDVVGIKVTKSGIFILDRFKKSQLLFFDHNGSFKNKIGEYGHGKGEYQFIKDFSANADGDSVIIMTLQDFLTYKNNGKFVSSYPLGEEELLENVVVTRKGAICTRNYKHSDHLVCFCDKNFRVKGKAIDVSPEFVVKNPPFVINTLQLCGNQVCYLDQYESTFYILDEESQSIKKRYVLKSKNMATLEDDEDLKKDRVVSYIYSDGMITGTAIHCNSLRRFEIDTNNDTFYFYKDVRDLMSIKDYYDGYYYALVSASEMIYLTNEKIVFLEKTIPSVDNLRLAFKPYLQELNENNNFYIVKIRKQ